MEVLNNIDAYFSSIEEVKFTQSMFFSMREKFEIDHLDVYRQLINSVKYITVCTFNLHVYLKIGIIWLFFIAVWYISILYNQILN